MLINLICLGLLSVIITSLIRAYGSENQTNLLKNVALAVEKYVSDGYVNKINSIPYDPQGDESLNPHLTVTRNDLGYSDNSTYSFPRFVLDNYAEIKSVTDLMSDSYKNALIFITDGSGEIIISAGGTSTYLENEVKFEPDGEYIVSSGIMSKLLNSEVSSEVGDLDGLLLRSNIVASVPICDTLGNSYGGVFVCSSDIGVDSLLSAMQKTIIMSCLWIILASLIVTYFISERLVAPLRDMSRAAKAFSNGDFSVRVEAEGNDEVAELASAINEMASNLQELEDMRRTFLANVSHDLRTPMTTISGFIDGILDGAIPPDKYDYYLSIIGSEVKRLSRLVVTLLDITKIEAGERKFTPVSFDIAELARLIMISFEKKIDEKQLNIEFKFAEERMFVLADVDAIHQVLYNICDNGVKFSREKGRVILRIDELNGVTTVSVYNEGVGIPADEQKYIFDRFYKGDKSRGLDKTGVGLGMYISRTIIEAHGQKIWVESKPDDYCKFSFTLPTSYED